MVDPILFNSAMISTGGLVKGAGKLGRRAASQKMKKSLKRVEIVWIVDLATSPLKGMF